MKNKNCPVQYINKFVDEHTQDKYIILEKLTPYTEYNIIIAAKNVDYTGLEKSINITTQANGKRWSRLFVSLLNNLSL